MSTYRRSLTVSKWDILVKCASRKEFYFLLGRIKTARALWKGHAMRCGYPT